LAERAFTPSEVPTASASGYQIGWLPSSPTLLPPEREKGVYFPLMLTVL